MSKWLRKKWVRGESNLYKKTLILEMCIWFFTVRSETQNGILILIALPALSSLARKTEKKLQTHTVRQYCTVQLGLGSQESLNIPSFPSATPNFDKNEDKKLHVGSAGHQLPSHLLFFHYFCFFFLLLKTFFYYLKCRLLAHALHHVMSYRNSSSKC